MRPTRPRREPSIDSARVASVTWDRRSWKTRIPKTCSAMSERKARIDRTPQLIEIRITS